MALDPCREYPIRNNNGYGRRGRTLIHRWVWEQVNGPIPTDMIVMHLCDNPPCYRLSHLRLGTRAENQQDMVNKGRKRGGRRTGDEKLCSKGHLLDEANTRRRRDGGRVCKTCHREAERRRRGEMRDGKKVL